MVVCSADMQPDYPRPAALDFVAVSERTTLDVLLRQESAVVTEVVPGGLGDRAGILVGDRIAQVQGWRVRGSADMRRVLDLIPDHASVILRVKRDGRTVHLGPTPLVPDFHAGVPMADLTAVRTVRPDQVLVVTTDAIPGCTIKDVIGLVRAAGSRANHAGGTDPAHLTSAFDRALLALQASAAELGANSVLGLTSTTPEAPASAEVSTGARETVLLTGTAAWAEPITPDHTPARWRN